MQNTILSQTYLNKVIKVIESKHIYILNNTKKYNNV